MAIYHTLLELEIEDPVLGDVPAQRLGFTTSPMPLRIDPGDGGLLRDFGVGLISFTPPGRRGDFYTGASMADGSPRFDMLMEALDARDLYLKGIRLQRIRASVWWWREGWTLAQAVRVWRGRVADPDLDPDRGRWSASLVPATREVSVQFPPGQIGDEGRFDATLLPQGSSAVAMPVIYGDVPKMPIYALDPDALDAFPTDPLTTVRYMVAAHDIPQQTVQAFSDSGLASGPLGIKYDNDGRGQRFSYVELNNGMAGWQSAPAPYLSPTVQGWRGPAAKLGKEKHLDRLGDILIHLLSTYSEERFGELDRTRIYGARVHLNRFFVGMWFNTKGGGVSLVRILKSRFESQFPVTFNFSGGLFGWDYVGVPEGASTVGSIVWRQNAHRRTTLRPVSADLVRSSFEVHYAGDGFAGGTTATVSRNPGNCAMCRAARDLWGESEAVTITAPDVADDDSARVLIEDQVLRLTKRRARITYEVTEPGWVDLPLFSRVAVTDPTWGWTEEPMLIEAIRPVRPGLLSISLLTENGR